MLYSRFLGQVWDNAYLRNSIKHRKGIKPIYHTYNIITFIHNHEQNYKILGHVRLGCVCAQRKRRYLRGES